MRQVIRSIWWWTRLVLLVVVAIYAMASLWCNSGERVNVWYWIDHRAETSAAALALASFLAGGVICTTAVALFRATVKWRRTRELRQRHALEEQRQEIARKAARLRVKPAPQPIVRVKEPPAPPTPIFSTPAPAPTPAPPPVMETFPIAERPAESPPLKEVKEEPVVVEATRATPFAMNPIAPAPPGEPKPKEPLPMIDEKKDASGPVAPFGGEG